MNVPTYMFTLKDVQASIKFVCEIKHHGTLRQWSFDVMELCNDGMLL